MGALKFPSWSSHRLSTAWVRHPLLGGFNAHLAPEEPIFMALFKIRFFGNFQPCSVFLRYFKLMLTWPLDYIYIWCPHFNFIFGWKVTLLVWITGLILFWWLVNVDDDCVLEAGNLPCLRRDLSSSASPLSVPGCSCNTPYHGVPGYSHSIYHTTVHGVPGYSGKLYLGYLPILAATNRGYLNRPWTRQVGTDQFMNRVSGSQTLEERPNHHRPKVYFVSVPTQKLHLVNMTMLNCIPVPRIATGEQTREKTK